MTPKAKCNFFVLILLFCIVLSSTNLQAYSNQAVIPLNITVLGKLIITDAENDNKSGLNPTSSIFLRITPDLGSSVVSGSSGIRIRTNLNSWKLTAQRKDLSSSNTNIDPKDVSLTLRTESGNTADPNCAKLLSPFDEITNISQISSSSSTEILIGSDKTSIAKDPENKNNWFQLTSTYSIVPDFFYDIGDWNTTISYNLVSP